jgi:hypothetical protein
MEKILLTKEEALKLAGGKLSAWQMNTDLIKRPGFPVVRIGRRVYIHRQRFIEWWEEEMKRQTEL